jgi:hypothetical protein
VLVLSLVLLACHARLPLVATPSHASSRALRVRCRTWPARLPSVAGAGFYAWVFKRWRPYRPACALCAALPARRRWSAIARARQPPPLDANRSLGFIGSGNWGKERARASLQPCVRERDGRNEVGARFWASESENGPLSLIGPSVGEETE